MNFLNPHVLEGDFIETHDGLIFDAKGIRHPDENSRKIAYVRYIPVKFLKQEYELLERSKKNWMKEQIEKDFDIIVDDIRYGDIPYVKIYDIVSRYTLLYRFKPSYVFESEMFDFPIQTVPIEDIKTVHRPDQFLKTALALQNPDLILEKLIEFITTGAEISKSCIGLSGSKMLNLEGDISDYDLIIYGEEASIKVHEFLEDFLFYPDGQYSHLRNVANVYPYTEEFLKKLYLVRGNDSIITYEQFRRTESKKSHQFLIDGREVFIRYLKENRMVRKSSASRKFSYRSQGRVSMIGRIVDDADSIFTPGSYTVYITEFKSGREKIKFRKIKIYTMRGRFLENAHLGDTVFVKGKLEKVIRPGKPTFQVVLGTDPDDLLIQI